MYGEKLSQGKIFADKIFAVFRFTSNHKNFNSQILTTRWAVPFPCNRHGLLLEFWEFCMYLCDDNA